jgi:hypothetical protein
MTTLELLHWLLDAQTVGGLLVLAAFAVAALAYVLMLRWILLGAEEDSEE